MDTPKRSLGNKRLFMLASLGGLAVAGAAVHGTAAVAETPSSVKHKTDQQRAAPHIFVRNASGLTLGSELDATTPASAPDLIEAYATNGKLGYVMKKDLHPAGPTSPTGALQANRARSTNITVYKSDGKTVIGVFQIDPGSGKVN